MGIFNFKRKQETIITDVTEETVEGAQVWLVSWDARFGGYLQDKKRVAKAFLDEDSANAFKESLIKAKALLQYTENLNIKIEPQE